MVNVVILHTVQTGNIDVEARVVQRGGDARNDYEKYYSDDVGGNKVDCEDVKVFPDQVLEGVDVDRVISTTAGGMLAVVMLVNILVKESVM